VIFFVFVTENPQSPLPLRLRPVTLFFKNVTTVTKTSHFLPFFALLHNFFKYPIFKNVTSVTKTSHFFHPFYTIPLNIGQFSDTIPFLFLDSPKDSMSTNLPKYASRLAQISSRSIIFNPEPTLTACPL